MHVLITGGAGFIGSALIRRWLARDAHTLINVDALTYAAVPGALSEVETCERYHFEHADIRDRAALDAIFDRYRPDGVIHLAAESHVDRSIAGPDSFIETNIVGTQHLLDAALRHYRRLDHDRQSAFRFVQVSTDEVYGSASPQQAFDETSPFAPNSPYAASKAAADHLVRAWQHTYGLPTLVSHGANTYGPFQYPDKLVPVAIRGALSNTAIPLYGCGGQERDWLYVDDHAEALIRIFDSGVPGRHYNIGTGRTCTNIDLVSRICDRVDAACARTTPSAERIRFVSDRAGHDQRYALDTQRLRNEVGWAPYIALDEGLAETVRWFIAHPEQLETSSNRDRCYADRSIPTGPD